jgi:antitoxin PrlF
MYCSTVTHKGQITIPVHIRNALGIEEGDKVEFIQNQEGITLIPFKEKSILDLCGFFPRPDKPLSIAEMNDIITSRK